MAWHSMAQHSRAGQGVGRSPLRQIPAGHQVAGGGQTWHPTGPQSSAPQHCCCAAWDAAPPPLPPPPPAETAPHTLLHNSFTNRIYVHHYCIWCTCRPPLHAHMHHMLYTKESDEHNAACHHGYRIEGTTPGPANPCGIGMQSMEELHAVYQHMFWIYSRCLRLHT